MLTQIYEISSAQEAAAISAMGVDHIGVLVGDGSFPREQSPATALQIAASIRPPAKFSALFLSPDIAFIVRASESCSRRSCTLARRRGLSRPSRFGSSSEAFRRLDDAQRAGVGRRASKSLFATKALPISCCRQLPAGARPNRRPRGDPRSDISRQIVERVRTPVILAGGFGPDNVPEAIRAVRPAGMNSKTKTNKGDTHMKDLQKVEMFERAAKRAAA